MRVAVTGSNGRLGRALVHAFASHGDEVLQLSRPDFDITSGTDLERITRWQPDVVINSAAWTDVDGCARDPARATLINGTAAAKVAAAAADANAMIIQISTNEVFEGTLDRPYREDDETGPNNPYGRSKLAGEVAAASANPRCVIVRTAWLFGGGRPSFPERIRLAADRAREAQRPLQVVSDEVGNPTPVASLAEAIVALSRISLDITSPDIYHLAGQPIVSRLEWAREVLGDDAGVLIEPVSLEAYPRDSRVPSRAALDTAKAVAAGIPSIRWRDRAPAPATA